MNLVKKTPVRLQWRLSTSLSYRRRRDRGGEIREEEEEEEARERGLTVEGEKCFPSASLFFFILCPSVLLLWLVSFVKA